MSTQGTRVAGSTGTVGAIIAAMSCTACFPALASLASADEGMHRPEEVEGEVVDFLSAAVTECAMSSGFPDHDGIKERIAGG